MPKEMFARKLERNFQVNETAAKTRFLLRDYERGLKAAYPEGVSETERTQLNDASHGKVSKEDLPVAMQEPMKAMRDYVDGLSQAMIEEGVIEGRLAGIVERNKGFYLHRSYQVHDDPKWADKVPDDVRNRAKALVRMEMQENYDKLLTKFESGLARQALLQELTMPPIEATTQTPTQRDKYERQLERTQMYLEEMKTRLKAASPSEEKVLGYIDKLLYSKGGPIQILSEEMGVRKDLSILRKRKKIPWEIRELLGEYKDPRINFVKTVSKMSRTLANHRFLTDIREAGMGKWFHDKPMRIGEQSFSAQISAKGNMAIAPLDGLYTTPEIRDALVSVQTGPQPDWLRYYMAAVGTTKYAKTILSLTTHVRNFMANPAFLLMNGLWDPRGGFKALRAIGTNLGVKNDKELREYILKLYRNGVIGESARAGELRDVIKDVQKTDFEVIMGNRAQVLSKKSARAVEGAYAAEDDYWKIVAYEAELARYKKALPNVPQAELEKRVAEIIRNTMPTYSLVPPAIKAIRRVPFVGTFVSFPAEVFRTNYHTMRLINEELRDPKRKKIGAQRLAGVLSAVTAAAAVAGASRMLSDVSADEEEDMRRFLPPWSENSQLFWIGGIKDGRAKYIDLGYLDPHTYLKTPVIAMMRDEDWEKKLIESAVQGFKPFFSEDIFTEKVVSIMRNWKPQGGKVYNEQADLKNKITEITKYLTSGLEPGTVTAMRRLTIALTGQPVNIYGKKYNPWLEALATFGGQRVSEVDVGTSLTVFKAFRFKDNLLEARRVGKKERLMAPKDSAKWLTAGAREREAIRRTIDDFRDDVAAAMRLGVPKRKLIRGLKQTILDSTLIRILVAPNYNELVERYVSRMMLKQGVREEIRKTRAREKR
jgi:hypothetical protein